MATTKRGRRDAEPQINARVKILNAATKIFADHGFKNATTRMISSEARVNVALVNYYFRSKSELYRTVISELFEDVAKPMLSIPDTVTDGESWKLAMRTWVRRSLAICAADRPPDSYAARLMGMEECVPSDLAQDIEHKFAEPVRRRFFRLIRMALPAADPQEINLWASSVSAQSVVYAFTNNRWGTKYGALSSTPVRTAWLDKVAEHICDGIFCRLSFQTTDVGPE